VQQVFLRGFSTRENFSMIVAVDKQKTTLAQRTVELTLRRA
jgi:translation elongation factor EF-4